MQCSEGERKVEIAWILAALIGGLLLGLGVGWALWARACTAAIAARDERFEQFRQAITDLAGAEERARKLPAIEEALERARVEREAAMSDLSALRAERGAIAKSHAEQLRLLREMEEQIKAQFGQLASTAMNEAQTKLLERAHERFAEADKASETKLKLLLSPVETTLKRYEENLSKVEKEREGSYRELNKAVADLAQGNDIVRRETQRLANVMGSSPKARGRWGEEHLKNILERAGLAENIDFELQSSVSDGEQQLRPDCVIHLPGDRCIVVDVKCPLVHFEAAYDEEDETARAELLLKHAKAMKSYANDLGRKDYARQFPRSPDFTIMFIPGEHFLSAAAERAPDLIETAFRGGVIIASTINTLALAKVMAGMWRQEALAEQAEEIAKVGKELYKRLATMGAHVAKLGRNLNLASGAYNEMVGSLERNVMTQAKRFEELKVDTGGKVIEALPTVETSINPLTKLIEPLEAEEDEQEQAAE